MFERDAQPLVDGYLAGRMSEAEFLAKFAAVGSIRDGLSRARGARPRARLASGRGQRAAADRQRDQPEGTGGARHVARGVSARGQHAALGCPQISTSSNFAETMKGTAAARNRRLIPWRRGIITERFYEAQCAKDETMGEPSTPALTESPGAIVVHYNGSFHSDFALGTAERAKRRVPWREDDRHHG